MTGTDLCVNKCKHSRSYLNHLVYALIYSQFYNLGIVVPLLIKSVIKSMDPITQLLRNVGTFTATCFGHTLRLSPGSLQIHIHEV